MGFSKWESFLEKHIEGFFNKKFGSELEAPEVSRQLEREIIRRRKKNRNANVVPNAYRVYMSVEDYQRLCSTRFQGELCAAVEKQVILQNCFMDGRLQISLEKNSALTCGMCDVRSSYAEDKDASQPIEVHDSTLVADRKDFSLPYNLPMAVNMVSLTVISGPDIDAYLEFGEKQIYIGRRDKNDFILTDENASRLHAYISYERHRHVLYDAQSLNGTLLNGQKIVSMVLCSGDEIQVGNTVLLYEVI